MLEKLLLKTNIVYTIFYIHSKGCQQRRNGWLQYLKCRGSERINMTKFNEMAQVPAERSVFLKKPNKQ